MLNTEGMQCVCGAIAQCTVKPDLPTYPKCWDIPTVHSQTSFTVPCGVWVGVDESRNTTHKQTAVPLFIGNVGDVVVSSLHTDQLLLRLRKEHDHTPQQVGDRQGVGDGQTHQTCHTVNVK